MVIVESIKKQLDAGRNYTAVIFADLKSPLTQWITTIYYRKLITMV